MGSRIANVFKDIGLSLNIFGSSNYTPKKGKIKSDEESLRADWDAVGDILKDYIK